MSEEASTVAVISVYLAAIFVIVLAILFIVPFIHRCCFRRTQRPGAIEHAIPAAQSSDDPSLEHTNNQSIVRRSDV